jgi:hypothetical protein
LIRNGSADAAAVGLSQNGGRERHKCDTIFDEFQMFFVEKERNISWVAFIIDDESPSIPGLRQEV